jgi:hypothetical protein
MKTIMLAIVGILTFAGIAYCGTPVIYDKEITLSTATGTMVDGQRVNRRYFLVVNTGAYDVLCSTYQQRTGDTAGRLIPNSNGAWEEDFYCYISSYYCIALSTGTASPVKVKITVKE